MNATAGEQCDDSDVSATCTAHCQTSTCGDGIVNELAGEECDSGPLPIAAREPGIMGLPHMEGEYSLGHPGGP